MSNQPITVTSHVARDFLQNADYFSTVPKVVWEYVSNSLDNPRDGQSALVDVTISPDRIVVKDNGRGMSRDDLIVFFEMHGRNVQRQQGRVVRGRFGTGKCAAFGVARSLRIETTKDGRYNVVQLDREAIEASTDGKPFRVDEKVVDVATDGDPGTVVVISRLLEPRRLEIDDTRRYVERHLGRHQQSHEVIINGHACEFVEPVAIAEYQFDAPGDIRERIGESHLSIRVAPAPLDADENGIDVISHGLWHDTTLGDLARQGSARRIFGEVVCDLLETWVGEPSPFDNTRNNTLNPSNPIVATLLGWVSARLRDIVASLDAAERQRKKSDEARKLMTEAKRLGQALEQDFKELQRQLAKIRRDQRQLPGAGVSKEAVEAIGPVSDADDPNTRVMPGDGDMPTEEQQAGSPPGEGKRGSVGTVGDEPRPGRGLMPGEQAGTHHKREAAARVKSTFGIEFVNETAERDRSHYDRESRTIFINLDHPQLAIARSTNPEIESSGFRQVVYEIAFVEYALALMTEEAYRDALMDPHDVLFDVRRTVNRLSSRIAQLIDAP
jgi:hypothetical protein